MRLPFAKKDIIRFLVVRILPMNVVRIENVGPGPALVVHRFVGRVIMRVVATKGEFTAFVRRTLEEVIQLAETHTRTVLPRKMKFRWLGHDALIVEGIVEAIVNRVYVDEENIYPCVDIGVGDLSDEGSPIIVANVAGYNPRPFGKNWTGREGPFVFIIGRPFLDKLAGSGSAANHRAVGIIIPDMKNLKR